MRRFRKTVLAGQVWLMAIMTLVAGLPRLQCVCPDGHIKPFCLRSCCARAEYAPSAKIADKQQHDCCCGKGKNKSKPAGPESRLDGGRCLKTIVSPADTTDGQTETPAATEWASAALLSPLGIVPCSPGTTCARAWLIHSPAPPTDLLTLLQHFLI